MLLKSKGLTTIINVSSGFVVRSRYMNNKIWEFFRNCCSERENEQQKKRKLLDLLFEARKRRTQGLPPIVMAPAIEASMWMKYDSLPKGA